MRIAWRDLNDRFVMELLAVMIDLSVASPATTIPYNTRIVMLGTLLLGMCSGVVGVFMLLRKKALVGDVASHAALPGIGIV